MSTLQNPPHGNKISPRPGAKVLALSTLAAIGLALLILVPTNHRATAPTAGSIAHEAALTAQIPAPAGCFRDPATTLSAVPTPHRLPPRTQHPPATSATQPRTSSCASPPRGTPQDNTRPTTLTVASFRKPGWIKGGALTGGPSTTRPSPGRGRPCC
jgi:hypothetical protein